MWFILGVMDSPAGTSALDGYHRARARRRHAMAAGVSLLVLAGGLAGAAAGVAQGRARVALGAVSLLGLILAGLTLRSGRDPERWLRGAAAEIATAAFLDRLPPRTWAVLHDRRVPGSRANLDHLVIGPSGVWLIDTKSTRARVRAAWRAVYFGDRRLDSGPTRWEAQVVADRLGLPVRPLIVVHDDRLRRRGGRAGGVRVVRADRLLRCLRRPWRGRRLDGVGVVQAAEAAAALFPAAASQVKGAALRGR